MSWPGQNGPECISKCQATYSRDPTHIEYYTQSEFDWLLVEVNLLWRRDASRKNRDGSKDRYSWYCRYYECDKKDKADLDKHLVKGLYPTYDYKGKHASKLFPPYVDKPTVNAYSQKRSPNLAYSYQWHATAEDDSRS